MTPEIRVEVCRLWRAGWAPEDIARKTGVDGSTVRRIGVRLGVWKIGRRAVNDRMTTKRCFYLQLRVTNVGRWDALKLSGIQRSLSYAIDAGTKAMEKNSEPFVPSGPDAARYKRLMARMQHKMQRTDFACESVTQQAVEKTISSRYLSAVDRERIADLRQQGLSMRAIARAMGRAPSTISRELARNKDIRGAYRPYAAHRCSVFRRLRPKIRKLNANPRLAAVVKQGLLRKLSPEQIAGRLRVDYPDDETMRVSHETIYQSLFVQAKGKLRKDIADSLRRGRAFRQPRGRKKPRFDEMIMISDRPAVIEDRAVPGHWEGDLIIGKAGQSAIGTLVERTTRYVMLLHLPQRHDAQAVKDALIKQISTLPEHLRGSLTWDQGVEMAKHKQFSIATGCPVYFCNPASPWQRGSNENTNGLLRQYFPKGTDLSQYSHHDLEYVAQELNMRPRKTLGYRTPAEKLAELLDCPPENTNQCCNDH